MPINDSSIEKIMSVLRPSANSNILLYKIIFSEENPTVQLSLFKDILNNLDKHGCDNIQTVIIQDYLRDIDRIEYRKVHHRSIETFDPNPDNFWISLSNIEDEKIKVLQFSSYITLYTHYLKGIRDHTNNYLYYSSQEYSSFIEPLNYSMLNRLKELNLDHLFYYKVTIFGTRENFSRFKESYFETEKDFADESIKYTLTSGSSMIVYDYERLRNLFILASDNDIAVIAYENNKISPNYSDYYQKSPFESLFDITN